MASVPITVLLDDGPLLCSFNVAIKGLKNPNDLYDFGTEWISKRRVRVYAYSMMYCAPSFCSVVYSVFFPTFYWPLFPELKWFYFIIFTKTSSVAAGFGQHGMPPPAYNLDLWQFDLEIGTRIASKVENLSSKFGHARPLGSRIIRYVRDGRTDGWTKTTLIAFFPK